MMIVLHFILEQSFRKVGTKTFIPQRYYLLKRTEKK